jgi:hypothetical protein
MTDNLPTKWDEELAKHATKAAALERPAVGRIGFKGGIMTYQGQAIPGNKLNVVIAASAKEHALYANIVEGRAYDPNKPESPICFALSLSGEDMIPHPQATKKQAATCLECKWHAWGSDPKGGKGKACKESRRLVVLPSSAVVQGNIPAPVGGVKKSESASASIPPTSIKNWANYTAQLAGEFRRPPWAMVTELSLHGHAKNQIEVKFAPVGLVDDSHLGDLMQRVEVANGIVMTPYAPTTEAAPPQPQQGRKY